MSAVEPFFQGSDYTCLDKTSYEDNSTMDIQFSITLELQTNAEIMYKQSKREFEHYFLIEFTEELEDGGVMSKDKNFYHIQECLVGEPNVFNVKIDSSLYSGLIIEPYLLIMSSDIEMRNNKEVIQNALKDSDDEKEYSFSCLVNTSDFEKRFFLKKKIVSQTADSTTSAFKTYNVDGENIGFNFKIPSKMGESTKAAGQSAKFGTVNWIEPSAAAFSNFKDNQGNSCRVSIPACKEEYKTASGCGDANLLMCWNESGGCGCPDLFALKKRDNDLGACVGANICDLPNYEKNNYCINTSHPDYKESYDANNTETCSSP